MQRFGLRDHHESGRRPNDKPFCRRAACRRRDFIASLLNKYAVSRSDWISRQSSMGTMTAVGSPLSPETIWISGTGTVWRSIA
jgi:hypothetical protein